MDKNQQRRTVQQYVTGEATTADYGFSSLNVGRNADEVGEPEAPANATEPSLIDKTDMAEEIAKGEVKPAPMAEQRKFSVDWDPTRFVHSAQSIRSEADAI